MNPGCDASGRLLPDASRSVPPEQTFTAKQISDIIGL